MDEFDKSEASDEDVTDDPDPAHLANYLRINPNLLLDHTGGPNPVTRWNFHDQEQLPAIPEEEEEEDAAEEVDEREEILQSSELDGSRRDDLLNS
jgi:hypothetical protein